VTGPDAARLLEWVCDNVVARGPGSVTYTQALNSRGGIESDFTVTQLDDQAFRIITGTALGGRDLGWLRKQARGMGADVRIADVTGQLACFALWGPRARDVLSALTPAELSNAAFPFMSSQAVTVGDVPVRALRVTFVGELGWELYCPAEYGAGLWRVLWDAGEPHGMIAAGYRAIESMRLEKSYRVWGSDIGPERTPYEAGLGFAVKLDKPGGFLGGDALVVQRDAGVRRRLRALTLEDPRQVVLGNEPVRVGDRIVGQVTSGGYGYTVGRSIAYAYLPMPDVGVGTAITVELFGREVPGVVVADPLFDPKSSRVRADAGE
jgi:4-methylaminobutanoate oxidase (formaldehyde-forming)